ncbi:MAG: DEAD/DEAH box helicase [Alcanivoracaceae bacterium]|nr:DEAD/DEAH box helicase [Alcanivoracaceae bacterium]
MLKIPMGFKGPKGQIQQLFSQELVYQATHLLLNGALIKWQHKQQIETINAIIEDDDGLHRLSISWPLSPNPSEGFDEPIGSCDCKNSKPCVHLAALMIESKTRLDQLPPFTQQLQASQNIAETFSNWMSRQQHDPYPNMARHRLVYILDYDTQTLRFNIALHKAYISTEGRYTLKSQLNSSLLDTGSLPKFVSLADQVILHLLTQNLIVSQHQFELQENRDIALLTEILLTGRCFWKAIYRTPLEFEQKVSIINPGSKKVINDFYLSINENSIATKIQAHSNPLSINLRNDEIIPHLHISSHEICVNTAQKHYIDIDVAKISFMHANNEWSFADLSAGKIIPDSLLLNQMAGYLRQVENLNSLFAHYEQTVLQSFHLNDRFIEHDFSAYAHLLRGLQLDGWKITIDKSFRMNRRKAKDWYAQLKQNNSNDSWFDLELGVKIDGQSVNILPYLVKAIRSGKWQKDSSNDLTIKLNDGTNIGLAHTSIKQIFSTLTELYDDKSLNNSEQLNLSSTQLIRVNQLQQSLLSTKENKTQLKVQGDNWLKEKAKQLAGNISLDTVKPPENLKATMRDYQLTGLSWLQFLTQHDLGGILADDMGLGKTLQVLAHILTEKNNNRLKAPCLIVVPTSLLSNWQTEIRKFAPSLSSILLVGPKREKLYLQIHSYDIVITSYGIMTRDVKLLTAQKLQLLILDEAQTIKNAKTRAAKVASSIPAQHRLCLSGTPIENHLGELWSLFNFLMPGFLGSQKQFEHIYQTPIERLNDQDRQADLSKRVSPFMLRRTKSEVAKELPDKTEIVQIIELNEAQANLYETIRLTMSNEIKQAFKKSQGAQNKIIIGNALLRLRQVCCHPALLKLASLDTSQESAKLNWLSTVVPNMVEEGRRILLFSSFTSMLDIIQQHLNDLNIGSIMLTGKTPANKRGALIDKFQQGEIPVFLISLKAGGAGINLTTADTVIHFDPWWNPAAEAQASDRAHRIGQDKNVFVYKLITKGTVEQKIQKLQKHKHALAQGIFDNQGNISSVLNDSQWQDFLKPIE